MTDKFDFSRVNFRWWALFLAQVSVGVYLYSHDVEFAKFLLGGAFGQGVTGGFGAVKK